MPGITILREKILWENPKKCIRRKLKFNEFTVDSSENDRSAISVNNDIGVFGKKGNPTFSRTILGHVHINYNFRNRYKFRSVIELF